ncbi:MAG: WbqC family protein [Chitinophagaceae bacterium]|nr:WbqC family protein [Chitinophagaceae bacterium]
MTLAIMQPYLFPYLGYFQLMQAADKMLLLDDVAWINRGWINRNRILVQGQPQYLSFPVAGASQNKTICELELVKPDGWKSNIEKTLTMAYKKAPQFDQFFPVLRSILYAEISNLSAYIFHSLHTLCRYMQLSVELVPGTGRYGNAALKGQDRIVDLCLQEQATRYVNPPGGTGLALAPYQQRGAVDFVPALSIIDVLMNCEVAQVQQQLNEYKLV